MAEAYLVDTSVFVRWYLEQDGYQHALRIRTAFRDGQLALETIDSVRFELGNVLRKKGLLLGTINRDEYLIATRSLDDLEALIHRTDADALERAAALAADRNLRFFDALVADRALERDLTLLTTDKKLCNAIAGLIHTELLEGAHD